MADSRRRKTSGSKDAGPSKGKREEKPIIELMEHEEETESRATSPTSSIGSTLDTADASQVEAIMSVRPPQSLIDCAPEEGFTASDRQLLKKLEVGINTLISEMGAVREELREARMDRKNSSDQFQELCARVTQMSFAKFVGTKVSEEKIHVCDALEPQKKDILTPPTEQPKTGSKHGMNPRKAAIFDELSKNFP